MQSADISQHFHLDVRLARHNSSALLPLYPGPAAANWFEHVIYAWGSILAISYYLLLQVEAMYLRLWLTSFSLFAALFLAANAVNWPAAHLSLSASLSLSLYTHMCSESASPGWFGLVWPKPGQLLGCCSFAFYACIVRCAMQAADFGFYLFIIGQGIRRF